MFGYRVKFLDLLTVLKYSMPEFLKLIDISFVVITAATGCPFPIGLPMVTMSGITPEIKHSIGTWHSSQGPEYQINEMYSTFTL